MDYKTISNKVIHYLDRNNIQPLPHEYSKYFYSVCRNLDLPLQEYDMFSKLLNIILKISGSRKRNDEIDNTLHTLRKEPEKILDEEIQEKLVNFFKNNDVSDFKQNTLLKKTQKVFSYTIEIEKILKDTISDNGLMLDSTQHFLDDIQIDDSIENIEKHYKNMIDLTKQFKQVLFEANENLEQKAKTIESLKTQINELQNEFQKVKSQQDIDFLTQIYNRKAFEKKLLEYEENYKDNGTKYAICFIDIDHFKNINDKYGHLGGDLILSTFAKVLNSSLRSNDIVARWGGEEFVSLITYKEKEELHGYINRIQTIVKKHSFKYNDSRIMITFSGGVAFRENNYNSQEAVLTADELLYSAKKEGRNQVIFQQ